MRLLRVFQVLGEDWRSSCGTVVEETTMVQCNRLRQPEYVAYT